MKWLRDLFRPRPRPVADVNLVIGQRVRKPRGYPYPGTYLGSVRTTAGEERLVVEHINGCIDTFAPEEIEPD